MFGSARKRPARRILAGSAMLALTATVTPAQAAAMTPLMMPSASIVVASQPCALPIAATTGSLTLDSSSAPARSKAAAILGGKASALEAIRASQSQSFPSGPLLPAAAPSNLAQPLQPAAIGIARLRSECAGSMPAVGLAKSRFAATYPGRASAGDDFLESRRVSIGRTYFDSAWSRVKADRPKLGRELRRLVGGRSDRMERIEKVNRWVNGAVTYVEDRDLFQRADYWAGASTTLALGKGDCEDIALLKMHLLAEAGVPREDMVLTIARDLVRRADHAVLIVRHGDGFVMLDNATDTVLDASRSYDYQPVLSFGDSQKWLHGY